MTTNDSTADRAISSLVERQMRNWELAQSQDSAETRPEEREVFDFISISHSPGLPTAEIASLIGDRLGWPVFDRQILREMSDNDKDLERVYQCMDERDLSWLEEVFLGFAGDGISRNDYFPNLVKTVLAISRRCHVVFVGHATDLILPLNHGLRVQVMATPEFCAQAHAREQGLTADHAAKVIAELQHERAQFLRHHFQVDADEPTRHDLIVNLERFSVDGAVALILAVLRARRVDD
jgi:Cytidylate kinase-like family